MSQERIEPTSDGIDGEAATEVTEVGDVTSLTKGGQSGGTENKRHPYS